MLTYKEIDFINEFDFYWEEWLPHWHRMWKDSNLGRKTKFKLNPSKDAFRQLGLDGDLLGIAGFDKNGRVQSGYIGCYGPYLFNPEINFCEEWVCFISPEIRTARNTVQLHKEIEKIMEEKKMDLYTFVIPVKESPKTAMDKLNYFQQDTVYMRVT